MFAAGLLLLAPATCWDSLLRNATQGSFALLAAEGSIWHGQAQLALLEPASGRQRPVMPVSWRWRPGALVRGAISWDFSLAASPPFSLDASLGGLTARAVRLDLPAQFALERIPNAIGRVGWHGDMRLTSPQWRCTWRGRCAGNASLDWLGAAADIFPGRHLGDYKFNANAHDDIIDLNWTTADGDVRIAAHGELVPNRSFSIVGTLSGDPAFTSRLPNIGGHWVHPTDTPGMFTFDFSSAINQTANQSTGKIN